MTKSSTELLGSFITEYSVKNKDGANIPVYSVSNDKGFCRDYFSKDVSSKDKTSYKIVPRGCFAYNPSRINVGSIAWQDKEDAVIVSPLYVVFSTKGLNNDFLMYYLKSNALMSYIKIYSAGSVRNNLRFKTLSSFPVKVPSLKQQERIVAELDCLTDIIEKKKQQLDNLDKLAQSIFYDMFGDPITNEKSWKVEKLGEVVRDNYVGLVRSAKEQGDDKKFLYFKMNNISADGYVDLSKTTRIDATEAEKKKYELHYGDFLFNTRNSYELVGKSCVFNVQSNYPILLNNNILRLTFNDSLDPFFLSSLFKDRLMKEQLNEIKKGTTNVCAIYYKDLARTRIIIPDIQEQRAFRERLEVIEKQKELVKRSIVETETLFNSRMDYWFN